MGLETLNRECYIIYEERKDTRVQNHVLIGKILSKLLFFLIIFSRLTIYQHFTVILLKGLNPS
jgi:hypothetical protein